MPDNQWVSLPKNRRQAHQPGRSGMTSIAAATEPRLQVNVVILNRADQTYARRLQQAYYKPKRLSCGVMPSQMRGPAAPMLPDRSMRSVYESPAGSLVLNTQSGTFFSKLCILAAE